MTSRISLPDRDGMDEAQRRVFDMIVRGRRGVLVGPLRAALHNPQLAERWSQLGETLRFDTRLDPKHSELAVLLTARRWNSQLEWAIHRRDSERAGIRAEVIEAIRTGQVPPLQDPHEIAIYDYSVELLSGGNVGDATYAAVVALWGEAGVVELTALIGYYALVAATLNVHRIPLPDGATAELEVEDLHRFTDLPPRQIPA
ncbi:carboxymuconolactone decarboxylase family protein [Pararhodobacter sp.]|uniref:carboxymuconolactone decarboxylase family protein n=1 Tax=Pararhodobacter sp. TaxID=2127056 RepID=UPI002FDF6CA2|nr:carboxymuconolactone decarboxylase family protein [Pseudomonadota bacterium]